MSILFLEVFDVAAMASRKAMESCFDLLATPSTTATSSKSKVPEPSPHECSLQNLSRHDLINAIDCMLYLLKLVDSTFIMRCCPPGSSPVRF